MKHFLLSLLLLLATAAHADDWQALLPDDAYIAEVSLPGTHDSATGSGFSGFLGAFGESYARTQDIDIARQWATGIRAFDLRPCVSGTSLQINHGIIPTALSFDDALATLRDSLVAHPTEFVVIHLLHETDGDSNSPDFETLLHQSLQAEGIKERLVDFRRNLTVADLRGKMLILYRNAYTTHPAGGEMSGWAGYIDWNAQRRGSIRGGGTGTMNTATLYMQDFSNTSADGAVDTKCQALRTMLDFSTRQTISTSADIVWVYNFASAYSLVANLFGNSVSTSNGYRDNATYTHTAIIDYMNTHEAGPMGIILMDYAGVDQSGDYATRGLELTRLIIDNNTRYFARRAQEKLIAAHWEALQAEVQRLVDLRTELRRELREQCPDVYDDFSSRLTQLYTAIIAEKSRLKKLYEAGTLTLDDAVDSAPLEAEIEAIRQDAHAAQELAIALGISDTPETEAPAVYYNLRGERIHQLPTSGIVIRRTPDGKSRKVILRP